MKKILVIGSPGAGKSTFSKELHKLTDIPLHHLDLIWHRPDRTTIPKPEFIEKISKLMEADSWILDGNYSSTLDLRLKEADTVFFLDYPVEQCLEGARERVGKPRNDLPWQEESFDPEFKHFIETFQYTRRPLIYEQLLSHYSDLEKIYIFHSREEAEAYLGIMRNHHD